MAGYYDGKRILITGGTGAIGSALTRNLVRLNAKVTLVDDFSASGPWNVPKDPNVEFISGDILDTSVLARAFAAKPEVVFHLAAFFANQNSVDHPERDLMVNGMGTLRVMEAARVAGCKRVVYTSSSSVYDPKAPLPITEDAITVRLTTPYQVTKLAGEMYCWYFHQQYGIEVTVARVFSSYGPGELPGMYRNVIPNFLDTAMRGASLVITGTGDETRDFTYVDDVVDGLLRCGSVDDAKGKAFNLASGRAVQIRWLAEEINRMTGNGAGIVWQPRRDWDQKLHTLGSISAAQKVLGYTPSMDFHEGLLRTKQWVESNQEWIHATGAATQRH